VISESFGLCEYLVGIERLGLYYYEVEAQKGNALGITWLASSGDSGAAGCDYQVPIATQGLNVILPSSVPEVTAVGGTEFNEGSGNYWSGTNGPYGGSALSYIPETAWNDTAAALALEGPIESGGGGLSAVYKKPSWQTGPGVPNDGARDVPDVSLTASALHDPYLIVTGGEVGGIGGTSASAPAFAGMIAVLNQYLVQNGVQTKPGLGNINPKLYSMAAAGKSGVFHDVTTGDNIVPCQANSANCVNAQSGNTAGAGTRINIAPCQTDTPGCTGGSFGYTAGPGYDLVTGLGSVDAYNLITLWGGIPVIPTTTTLTVNPGVIVANGSAVLTATVKAASGTRSPTGPVSFTLGSSMLGTATLAGSGGSATASITVTGAQVIAPNNTAQVSYGGSPTFGPSSASATLIMDNPAISQVVVSVTPNPVYQQAPDANGATFSFNVQLKEIAGVATTVTGFTFDGVSFASEIAKFFGSTTLGAHGTLSANLKAGNITVPSTVTMVFTGQGVTGASWAQQIAVPFLPQQ
jgi:subtilase family serine protease